MEFENRLKELENDLSTVNCHISSQSSKNIQAKFLNFASSNPNIIASKSQIESKSHLVKKTIILNKIEELKKGRKLSDQFTKTLRSKYSYVFDIYSYVSNNTNDLLLSISSTGKVLSINDETIREHLYMVGSTGSGKSRSLESYIIQTMIAGKSGCLITPLPGLYEEISRFILFYSDFRDNLLDLKSKIDDIKYSSEFIHFKNSEFLSKKDFKFFSFLENISTVDLENKFPPLKYMLIDLSDFGNATKKNPYTINPFELTDSELIEDCVERMMQSIARFSDTPLSATPRLENVLTTIFTLAIVNKKDLFSMNDILESLKDLVENNKSSHQILKALDKYDEPIIKLVRNYIKNFLSMVTKREFSQIFESSFNRIINLQKSRVVSRMLDTKKTTLNLEKVINETSDRKTFILVNLPCHLDGSSFLGTFLLNSIESIILRRTEDQRKSTFHLFLDEFFQYVDKSIAERFAIVRQSGLAYCIAHQNLSQLETSDSSYINAIFGNTSTKIIYNLKDPDDAEKLSKTCFAVTGEMERVTISTGNTITEMTGYNISKGSSTGETNTKQESTSHGESWGDAFSSSHGESFSNQTGTNYSNTNGSVLSAKSEHRSSSSGYGSGGSSSTNKGQTSQESSSHNTGGSISNGTSNSIAINKVISSSSGETSSKSKGSSRTIQVQKLSFNEEMSILSQSIQKLDKREHFVCFNRLVTHQAYSLDSLVLKLHQSLLFDYLKGEKIYLEIQKRLPEFKENIITEKTTMKSKLDIQIDHDLEGIF